MRYYCGDILALTTVSLSEMEELGLDKNDIDGINNMPLSVKGIKIGIVVKQDIEPKTYKISVRTNEEYAANDICSFFEAADTCALPARGCMQATLKKP